MSVGGHELALLTGVSTTTLVLLGTAILGLNAGVVGVFTVLRRRSLVGDAVAHAALPGVCFSYFLVHDRSFLAFLGGALLFGLLAAATITFIRASVRIKEDAAIAITLGSYFGLGLVLSRIIQNQPSGNRAGIDGFIFGKAASMVRSDALVMSVVCVLSLGVVSLLYKELKLLCFDREFAHAVGWPVAALDLLLVALVCFCTVAGLPAVGIVMVVSLLTIPPTAAHFWSDRLQTRVWLSGAFGCLAGALGTTLSATLPAPAQGGWPTGPLITLVAAAFFLFSLLFAPNRGAVAFLLRRAALRRRIALQNLLRSVYEELERAEGGVSGTNQRWRPERLCRFRDHPRPEYHRAIRSAMQSGLVTRLGEDYLLTPEGVSAARRIVRAHRLWEIYLIERAEIAPDHVDRDADEIEHILEAPLIEALEAKLRSMGRLPAELSPSPHTLSEKGEAP